MLGLPEMIKLVVIVISINYSKAVELVINKADYIILKKILPFTVAKKCCVTYKNCFAN